MSLINKLARRFVMGGSVIIRLAQPYLPHEPMRQQRARLRRNQAPYQRRFEMQKTILTMLAAAVLATSTAQIAAAAEHHKARKIYRAQAPVSEPVRNSNDYYAPSSPWAESGWSRYEGGGISAPAGH
jgi:hypothetical protein